ncbi:hypothetical protein [Halorarum salinum]|uniref:Uncharacterized protein n=1 Tax=Halorarum salinum TaxID=2743089 RepID=A0A7D5QFA4_9EURY|nr:hypothetical protein [Halobaculum salinum]QLG60524.1 hypothetical protein HUG12_01675 [Halobaculum salinum]
MVIQKPGFVEMRASDGLARETAGKNVIEEAEARFEHSPDGKPFFERFR